MGVVVLARRTYARPHATVGLRIGGRAPVPESTGMTELVTTTAVDLPGVVVGEVRQVVSHSEDVAVADVDRVVAVRPSVCATPVTRCSVERVVDFNVARTTEAGVHLRTVELYDSMLNSGIDFRSHRVSINAVRGVVRRARIRLATMASMSTHRQRENHAGGDRENENQSSIHVASFRLADRF